MIERHKENGVHRYPLKIRKGIVSCQEINVSYLLSIIIISVRINLAVKRQEIFDLIDTSQITDSNLNFNQRLTTISLLPLFYFCDHKMFLLFLSRISLYSFNILHLIKSGLYPQRLTLSFPVAVTFCETFHLISGHLGQQ